MSRSIKRTEEIDRFTAKTDTGKEYVIIQYQDYFDAGAGDHPNDEIPGIKRLRTIDGLHVRFIDPKTFKIVETDEIVRKV